MGQNESVGPGVRKGAEDAVKLVLSLYFFIMIMATWAIGSLVDPLVWGLGWGTVGLVGNALCMLLLRSVGVSRRDFFKPATLPMFMLSLFVVTLMGMFYMLISYKPD